MEEKTFGGVVRELRLKKRYGLREFARMASISATYLSKIERDIEPPPSSLKIINIARTLGENSDELLDLANKLSPPFIKVFKKEANQLMSLLSKIEGAINIALEYGGIDGAHHKDWVIDQIVRTLAGNRYDTIIAKACDGEEGPNTYDWDCGTAP